MLVIEPMKTRISLLKQIGLSSFLWGWAKYYGLLFLVVESISLFVPNVKPDGWTQYFVFIILAAILNILSLVLKTEHREKLNSVDSEIRIKLGDIFDEKKGHLVIGTNDVFDTELGDIIKPSSVQGQFLSKVYENNRDKLDRDIKSGIPNEIKPSKDKQKEKGKNKRYPIGTCSVFGNTNRRYFFLAYSIMGNDLKCKSTGKDDLWHSLNSLWKTVRLKGQSQELSIPIIGSDLARTGLTRKELVNLIATSFILESKTELISERLNIIVHPKDLELVNWFELIDVLKQT